MGDEKRQSSELERNRRNDKRLRYFSFVTPLSYPSAAAVAHPQLLLHVIDFQIELGRIFITSTHVPLPEPDYQRNQTKQILTRRLLVVMKGCWHKTEDGLAKF